jgi:hypothetical protein
MTLMPTLFLIGGEGAAEIVGAVAFEVVAGAFDDEHYFLESYAVGAWKIPLHEIFENHVRSLKKTISISYEIFILPIYIYNRSFICSHS